MVRGIRGAITVEENEANQIIASTEQLLREMIDANKVEARDVAQVIISVTEDINDAFPAAALRRLEGWNYVPVMCTKEIPVPNSLSKCIRVMLTVNTNTNQEDINHIYLKNAVQLRPDLTRKNS
ncbi:chorismate mutase [Bacillus luteolus]|uniref:chorismate mutase n=1 Tax=Litchfieldia luteola TaxID=682179 RepID=A0ABR9QP64_9BACI|nr:chorismate mutase [Cytobacillus luteolus]MBE4910283.1 chorismate mutase [Cytobacillus luteolus]MBP1942144.1 chorismate mutase [Cytobacillus luteolus]